jgi:phospholipid-binding lipoprotein MlaA
MWRFKTICGNCPLMKRPLRPLALPALAAVLAGCGAPQINQSIVDPYEEGNRAVHAANQQLDQELIRPLSEGYGEFPSPLRIGISNAARNASVPRAVLNDLLQLRIADAAHNTLRFVINTTIGIGGLFDPAHEAGLDLRDNDFGKTLYQWGIAEGAYVELPFFGPSTQRDTLGMIVDYAIDPLGFVVPARDKAYLLGAEVVSKLGDRYTFGTTVDSILHESADSYAQSQTLYLQSRHYELQGSAASADAYEDPYAN